MKIQLNIDDKELSAEVKKLVNAQLKSIARNVVADLVTTEAQRVIGTLDKDKIDKLLRDEVKSQVSRNVGGGHFFRSAPMYKQIEEWVKEYAETYVKKNTPNVKDMYKDAFAKEIKKALKSAIGN